MELKKIQLEIKIGYIHTPLVKPKAKFHHHVLDDHHEDELCLAVIKADHRFYEMRAQLAGAHLSFLQRGVEPRLDSPELLLATAEMRTAYHEGKVAFHRLRKAFPNKSNKEMARPELVED